MKVYIHTFGCQMNEYDSERMAAQLFSAGHELVYTQEEADAVIINTCSVRRHAEERAYSYIGKIPKEKKIIVSGCMAQSMKRKIFASFPHIHAIAGTSQFNDIAAILSGRQGWEYTKEKAEPLASADCVLPPRQIDGYLAIMTGCDNFCAYCIVPYTRGREKSRKPSDIYAELKKMTDAGYREITLLGQNVNSYFDKETGTDFPKLLAQCAKTPNLYKLRFMTSHPKDLSEDLVRVVASEQVICKHIHLPVQSGSDKILTAMNRKYTRAQYLEKIAMIRKIMPDCAITTDILLGFPGETKEDFEETVSLIKEVRFDASYIFKYSVRTGTAAEKLGDTLTEDEKSERNNYVLELQKQIGEDINKNKLGCVEYVLAMYVSTRREDELECKLDSGKKVFVKAEKAALGTVLKIKITAMRGIHFEGELI